MSASAGEAPVYYRIDLDEEGGGDTTEVSDAGLVEQLAARTRADDATPPPTKAAVPPPTPLGPEASAFADRVRYAMMFRLGFGPDKVESVIEYARSLMPRAGVRR
jgi:hypothetical protein